MWNRTCRDLLRLFLLSPAVRLVLATLIRRPGYMNVAYYAAGAVRLAQGNGLSQPFLWNYLDDLAGSVAAVVLCMQIIRWRPRPWLWAATTLWCVLMYHDLQALILGQFAVFVLLALVAALWAMQRGCDGWAGFFLALSTVKPQMVYLAIPCILLWAAVERRWRLCGDLEKRWRR